MSTDYSRIPHRAVLTVLLIITLCSHAGEWAEYSTSGGGISAWNGYRTDPRVESRRTDHFLIRYGHERQEGILVEQIAVGHLQYLENCYETWLALGFTPGLGGFGTNKCKSVLHVAKTFPGDPTGPIGATGFGEGDGSGHASGCCVPASYLGYRDGNGCTPHEFGHGWGTALPSVFSESVANWIEQQALVDYPHDWCAIGLTMGHMANLYNNMSIFNYFMEAPGYGAPFLMKLFYDPNLNASNPALDDIIRKAIRCDTSGAKDKAGAIHDGLGMMCAKMLDMDFWNRRVNGLDRSTMRRNGAYDADVTRQVFHYARIPMVRQPGVSGTWYRSEFSMIPQCLSQNYIPLAITATGSPRTVACDFRPVADAVRGTSFRACFVAFNMNKEPRYSAVWNVGEKSFSLADDETAVYLAIIACPYALNPDLTHNDYTSDNVAMFPYRLSLTGAEPKGWQWAAPTNGFTRHPNGGGIVADTATVDASAFIGPNAMVLGKAKVYGNARIEDYALVDGDAVVGRAAGSSDDPVISGHAYVSGTAQVYGHAKVRDYGWVTGSSKVYDHAIVMAHSRLEGAQVFGNAVLNSTAVRDPSLCFKGVVSGCAIIGGDCGGNSPLDKGVLCEFPGLSVLDNAYQYLCYNFEKKSCVFAMDQYGMNHSYLIGEPLVMPDTVNGVTTTVLHLDGAAQYVELRPDAVDFADLTIAVWVKWTGNANDQMIFSCGNGTTKHMSLSPKAATTGKLQLAIGNGKAVQYLDGTAPLAPGTWTHVAVTLSANTGTLYVDGVHVAQNTGMTIDPDQLHAPLMENANFIGRNVAGNYFAGCIDEFKVLNKALTAAEVLKLKSAVVAGIAESADTTAPAPATATWLVPPTIANNHAITMSATEGTDAGSNGVLYFFRCVNHNLYDSGWISENKYTDFKCAAGVTYTYTVRMKDKKGNAGTESAPLSATAPAADEVAPTPNPPTFSSAPKGNSATAISMTATKGIDDDETVLYRFTRVGAPTANSGWTSSRRWTDTGLTPGKSYTYTLQVKDGHGNMTAITASAPAVARDDTPPALDADGRLQWHICPYTLLDKTVRMYAREQTETNVEYYYECVEQPAVSSGWTSTKTWITPAFAADGTYTFRFKLRDTSPQQNQSAWSAERKARVVPSNSYHDYALTQLADLPDSTLVRFSGKVTKVNAGNYHVSSADGRTSITVVPRTYNSVTDAALLNKTVDVKGHLWTYTGMPKRVTEAIVRGNPQSGKVEFENCEYTDDHSWALRCAADASGKEYLGGFPAGYAVTIPNVAATTQMTINYRKGGTISLYVNGTHAKDLTLPELKEWGPAIFTGLAMPASATLRLQKDAGDGEPDLDYVIVGPVYPVSGKVTSGGAGIAGATVYFSDTPHASANPHAATVAVDGSGNYRHSMREGTWYVCATCPGYNASPDQIVTVNGAGKDNVAIALVPNVAVAGKVTSTKEKTLVAGASVYFASAPGGAVVFTTQTTASGDFTQSLQNGTWYVHVGKTGWYPTPEQKVVVNGVARTGLDFEIEANPQVIPLTESLYFYVTPDRFTADEGAQTGNWQLQYLDGKNVVDDKTKFAVTGGSPSMEVRGAIKWVRNKYDDMEGYEVQNRTLTPILPFNGGTFVVVIKPTLLDRVTFGYGGQWILNVGYTGKGFAIIMMNDTGQLKIKRKAAEYLTDIFIPDGQKTVLTCVVQPDGSFKLYANGLQVYTQTATDAFVNIDLSSNPAHAKKVTIGEGAIWLDGSACYNGNIGDVLVYYAPLNDKDRTQLETHLMKKFAISNVARPAPAGQ